jgi:hypothetical protein
LDRAERLEWHDGIYDRDACRYLVVRLGVKSE